MLLPLGSEAGSVSDHVCNMSCELLIPSGRCAHWTHCKQAASIFQYVKRANSANSVEAVCDGCHRWRCGTLRGTKGEVVKLKVEDLVEDPAHGFDNDEEPVASFTNATWNPVDRTFLPVSPAAPTCASSWTE